MTKDIIAKLHEHLSRPVDTECTVVYLLAEVRKILERDKPDPKPIALWMYCHWALHVDLSRENTTLHFLERIDSFVFNRVSGFPGDGNCSFLDEHHLFREFLYLDTFRDQLRAFLHSYGLPTPLCDDDKAWFSFVSAYAGVIEDGTLSSGKADNLKAIEEVTFMKGKSLPSENHLPFVVQWNVRFKDGRTLRAELEATPELKMFSHGLALLPAK